MKDTKQETKECPYCDINITLPKHDEKLFQWHLGGHNSPAKQETKEKWEVEFGLLINRAFREGLWHSESVLTNDLKDFISSTLRQDREKLVERIINELESNPNEDGSTSPNIQHWIEHKQMKLRKQFINIIKGE